MNLNKMKKVNVDGGSVKKGNVIRKTPGNR